MQVIVDGLLTSYERTGKGKQLLLLHGWGDSSAGWRNFSKALSSNYEVIVPDLPGFGGTQAPEKDWGLSDYAIFVASFLKKIQAKPSAVIGHSNGGAIAIRGLGEGTFETDKLVLLASAGIRNEYKGRNKALRLVTKTGKVLIAPLPKSTKRKLRQKVYTSIGSDMLVAEHLQETFKRVVTDDVRADAAKLQIPTLLIYGEKDQQTPVRYGELFHETINGSTLEILPDADHFLHGTHREKVVKLIEDFLS